MLTLNCVPVGGAVISTVTILVCPFRTNTPLAFPTRVTLMPDMVALDNHVISVDVRVAIFVVVGVASRY